MTNIGVKLDFIVYGRETRRYHGLPMLDYQRVDAHQWGVAMLTGLILGPDAPAERRLRLLEAAMVHDLAEWRWGDMPAPTKRALPDYPIVNILGDAVGSKSFREVIGDLEEATMAEAGFGTVELNAADKRVLKMADAAEGCLHTIVERQKGNAHPRLTWCFNEFWRYCVEEQGMGEGAQREPGEHALRHWIAFNWTNAGGAWQ